MLRRQALPRRLWAIATTHPRAADCATDIASGHGRRFSTASGDCESPFNPPQNNVTAPTPAGNPALGLDGFCPVSLSEKQQWVRGDPRWGAPLWTHLSVCRPRGATSFLCRSRPLRPGCIGQRHRPGHRTKAGSAGHARARRVFREPRLSVLQRGFVGEVRAEPWRVCQSSVGSIARGANQPRQQWR